MSSPTKDATLRGDHLAYAPKWARGPQVKDLDATRSPSIATGDFADRTLGDQSLNRLLSHLATSAQYRKTGRLPLQGGEQPVSERDLLRRSLEPEIIKDHGRANDRREWRKATLIAFALVIALIGGAIFLVATENFPRIKIPDLNNDFVARFSGGLTKTAEPTMRRSIEGESQRIATLAAANSRGHAVRGVTNNEIIFGMAAPFSGSSKELGHQMKVGIETAFNAANENGGINGRLLKLTAADDGYEPTQTAAAMAQLYEKQQVFGFVGNVGTPTAVVALPYALEHRTLFFGAFTGADLLRRDPPDRYVFNYRASYAEETNSVVRYLINVRRLRPDQIAVFAQHDAYGDAGFAGVAKAVRALHGDDSSILRVGYERNTVDVDDAVSLIGGRKPPIKAVVMVATYRAAARFIQKTRDSIPSMIYTNVSFVGSSALADELTLLGPRYANGVIVTQVVPAVNGYASVSLRYRNALAKYFPGEPPDYVSLEGYVDGTVLAEALRRTGQQLDTEKLIETLESLHDFDMGLGTLISFSPSEHQASHKVWGTQLDEHGYYQPIDLE